MQFTPQKSQQTAKVTSKIAKSQTPKVITTQTPKITSLQTPKISTATTPKIITTQTPKITSLQTPKISTATTPKVITTQTPKISTAQTPKLTTLHTPQMRTHTQPLPTTTTTTTTTTTAAAAAAAASTRVSRVAALPQSTPKRASVSTQEIPQRRTVEQTTPSSATRQRISSESASLNRNRVSTKGGSEAPLPRNRKRILEVNANVPSVTVEDGNYLAALHTKLLQWCYCNALLEKNFHLQEDEALELLYEKWVNCCELVRYLGVSQAHREVEEQEAVFARVVAEQSEAFESISAVVKTSMENYTQLYHSIYSTIHQLPLHQAVVDGVALCEHLREMKQLTTQWAESRVEEVAQMNEVHRFATELSVIASDHAATLEETRRLVEEHKALDVEEQSLLIQLMNLREKSEKELPQTFAFNLREKSEKELPQTFAFNLREKSEKELPQTFDFN
jgi:hypothetical protein